MWDSKLSRRRFLALSGSTLATTLLGSALGQASSGEGQTENMLRIGVIIPTLSGGQPQGGFTESVVGEVANMGATMAADEIATDVELLDYQLKTLITSAMSVDAVTRAAERLASEEEAYAIIGGFSTEEALALSQLAAKRGFIFLNIGAQSDALRGEACNANTFHLAGSATMYLSAMTDWYIHSGFRRWFFVYNDSAEQKANYATAGKILKSRHFGGGEVGRTMVPANTPLYTSVFDDIEKADPDVVVLLLEPSEQLVFLGQYETSSLDIATIGYPSPATQTRQFYAASLQNAPQAGSGSARGTVGSHARCLRGARTQHEVSGTFRTGYGPFGLGSLYGHLRFCPKPRCLLARMSLRNSSLIWKTHKPCSTFTRASAPRFAPGIIRCASRSFWSRPTATIRINNRCKTWQFWRVKLPAIYEPNVPPVERLDQLGISEQDSTCHLEKSSQ